MTTERMVAAGIREIPYEIQTATNNQHKIINLLTHAIYTTSDTPYGHQQESGLLQKIPETNGFKTKTTFDAVFIKQQSLSLDKAITDLGRKISTEERNEIINRNTMIIAIQFEMIFKQKFPENMKIGFDKTTSPKDFTEYYKYIIKKEERGKLLSLIQFIKSNIAFQMSKTMNSNTRRSSEWFKTLNEQSSETEMTEYEQTAEKEKQTKKKSNEILKKVTRRKRTIIAIAGKLLLGAFANQAKNIALKKVKAVVTHKLRKEEDEMKVIKRPVKRLEISGIRKHAEHAVKNARIMKEFKTNNDGNNIDRALKKAQIALSNSLVIRDGMIKILTLKARLEELKSIQQKQLRYAQSIFDNEIPFELIDSIQGVPKRECKASISIDATEFVIKFEYFQTIRNIPTFKISTTPFLIENKAFEFDLPKEVIIMQGGQQTIENPREICGHECECNKNTPTYKINPCLEQVLMSKFSKNKEATTKECSDYIIPSKVKQEKIEKFRQDYFSIFAQRKTKATIECKNSKKTTAISRGLNKLEIPYGCSLETSVTQIKNDQKPTHIEAMNQKQNTEREVKEMMSTKRIKISQSLREMNYSDTETMIINIINKQAEIARTIESIQNGNLSTNIIWYGSGLIITIVTIIIASSLKSRIVAAWRKNILICGCCCTIRERDSEKQLKPEEIQLAIPTAKQRNMRNYNDLYGSKKSILSGGDEDQQTALKTPPKTPRDVNC